MALDIAINIIFGFIVPWIFGGILYFKDKRILLTIAPFMGIFAHTFNEAGFHMHFWRYVPIGIDDDLTLLSVNLGLYPILASYLIYFISKYNKGYLTIGIFSIFTVALDAIGISFKLIAYSNGWNLVWTLLLTVAVYLTVYWFYETLKKIGVFK